VRELSQESGVPFTFTAHGYDIRRKPPADFAERAAAARAVVTVSEANARYIVKAFGVPPEHIRVIPCGVDTDQFRPVESSDTTGRRLHSMEEIPWIVCVARHVRVKNLGLLLETCALLQARGARFRCAMIGDGPMRGDLVEQRNRLGLERIVELDGAQEQAQVLEWWRRASVAVLTSENEGMPVCLMEAAACGVPTVATAVGGVPELVEDGVTGFLVPPGDTAALAAALQKLMLDFSLAARMGTSARRRAEARFSVTRQVDRLLALWDGLLNQQRFDDYY
jgi:glycosyltransferase involved in cell wall biosynthesis